MPAFDSCGLFDPLSHAIIKLFSELNRIICQSGDINMSSKNLSDQFSRYSRQHVHFQRILSSTARAGAWSAPLNNTRPNQQHEKE